MTEFIRAFPPAAPVMGDIYARNMDWPQAEEIGERLEELLPPPIKAKLQAGPPEARAGRREGPFARAAAGGSGPAAAQQQAQQAQPCRCRAAGQGLKMAAEGQADKAEADARKAVADADKPIRGQGREGQLARPTWPNLRTIERHDQDMARGHVNHSRDHAHAMDRHGADMTIMGIEAHRAGEQHDASMEQMTQPEPASVQ
jgi:hypothetical protein